MNSRLSPLEAIMWRAGRDPASRLVNGVLLLLDRPLKEVDLVERMGLAAERAPRLQMVPDEPMLSTTRPVWVWEPRASVEHHIRSVEMPRPGSLRQVLDWIAVLDAVPFEPERSPWDATVIHGLEGGKGALFLRAHHVLSDGVGGTRLIRDLFDVPERATDDKRKGPARSGRLSLDELSVLRFGNGPGTITIDVTRALRSWSTGLERARNVRPVGVAIRRAQQVLDAANSLSRQVVVVGGPLAPMPPGRSVVSHFDVVSAPNVREVAIALGGSRNDMLVVAAAAALGQYFERAGDGCSKVRVAVPVRRLRDGEHGGNWFAPSRVEVPSSAAHPMRQFAIVAERLAQARREPAVRLAGALASALSRLPDRLLLPAVNGQADTIDLAVTTLPGFRGEPSICGARIESAYPIGPRLGTPLNVTAFATPQGGLDIGIALDPIAVTDPDRFRDCMLEAFAHLAAQVAPVPAEGAPARRSVASGAPEVGAG